MITKETKIQPIDEVEDDVEDGEEVEDANVEALTGSS